MVNPFVHRLTNQPPCGPQLTWQAGRNTLPVLFPGVGQAGAEAHRSRREFIAHRTTIPDPGGAGAPRPGWHRPHRGPRPQGRR